MSSVAAKPARPASRRAYLLVTLFAVVLIMMPFLFWHSTWFGRRLSDEETGRYLNEYVAKPREAQHALVQIGERLGRGDHSVRKWLPKVIEVSAGSAVELRQTAAWIMGQDHTYEPFRDALHKLLKDPSPMVRRNAALSLSNFRDDAARPELRAMLRPSTVVSPGAGVVKYRLKEGEYVNPGTLVARVGEVEARATLPGEVRALRAREGAQVKPGDVLADLAPDQQHVWEALRALYLIGQRPDLEDVQRFARGVPGSPEKIQQQAQLTLQAIESRGQ